MTDELIGFVDSLNYRPHFFSDHTFSVTKRRTAPFDFNVVLPKLKCLKQPVRRCQAAKENLDKSKLTAAKTKRYKLPARLYFQILLVKNVSRVSELIAEYGIEKKIES